MASSLTPSPAPDSRAVEPEEIHRAKLRWVKDGHSGPIPTNVEWINQLPPGEQARYRGYVLRKPSRTLSGVAVVAVMTAPARCPHGRCTYCPGGLENASPQSYTGEEPSALRGAQLHFDSRAITEQRLKTLDALGHSTSKVEVIVMGGTFPSRPTSYQESVFQGIYDGLNGSSNPTLALAQAANETAAHRCVGLTVETRPDWCDGRVLPKLLEAGVTRIELGVECLRDEVLLRIGRAHGVEDVIAASREARDRGLKVCYHLMLGLPGMSPEKDLEDFRRLFRDGSYQPDMLKIYPTLVLPGTELFEDWKRGAYEPYDLSTAADLIAREKLLLPPWVRIQRIQRDIPARLIAAGVRTSNIREVALRRLRELGGRCRCLRCREVGRRATPSPNSLDPIERRYPAAGGEEIFLSWEDDGTESVAGFLRLRFPSSATEGGLTDPVIRELKVLGVELPVGSAPKGETEYQHQGLGKRLVGWAEQLAAERGFRNLWVTSAVGSRAYYRRLGFSPKGTHMAKPVFSSRKT